MPLYTCFFNFSHQYNICTNTNATFNRDARMLPPAQRVDEKYLRKNRMNFNKHFYEYQSIYSYKITRYIIPVRS